MNTNKRQQESERKIVEAAGTGNDPAPLWALLLSGKISGDPIDLPLDVRNEVRQMVSSNMEFVQPLVRILIADMPAEDRIV
jgi:hypothetical protein